MSQPSSEPGFPPRPHGRLRLRLGTLGVAVVVLFMLLVLRLWALQVLNTRTFVAQAASNHEKQVVVRAPRGEILDRNGRVLVRNRVAYELDLDPGAVRDTARRHQLLLRVSKMLDLPPRPLWERVDRQLRMDPVAPVTLATDIDVKLKWYLQENPTIFHGLSVAQVPLRFYPYRTLGAHIYGQLSEIGPTQLQDPRFHDYHRGDVIGQSGVERRYDAFLRGTDGIDAVTVDAFGQPTGAVRHVKAPVPGRNVRLTIDLDTQRAAEQALARGVRSAASGGADAGAIVALDPKTGAIRALASYPTFDPNWFISYRKPKFKRQLTRITRQGGTPAHYPLLDRAIAGRYPAASTFKPFVAIAAVKERQIRTDELLPCTPLAFYYHKRFHNWDQTFNGHINLTEALERSCDTYFYRLGDDIFREGGKQGHPLQNWAAKFGFGKQTGIDIVGEDQGLLPDPAWKTKFYKQNFSNPDSPNYDPNWLFDSSWNAADELNLSIGQGNLNVTPLQLGVGYAAIANGGTVVTPHVVSAVQAPGEPTRIQPAPAKGHINIGGQLLSSVRTGLLRATHQPSGTATNVFGQFAVPVAGKTGTAQRAGEPDYALFASYAPVPNPSLVTVVVIERGGHGGVVGALTALDFYSKVFKTPKPNLTTVVDQST
ncbi:MAG TPA: penicillin-binding protein 2 [Gaiellales bacterium]|jgi:penicillin-binding protein 2|nr:penicillin-binding protein 2 [Gaiellales bacterium]